MRPGVKRSMVVAWLMAVIGCTSPSSVASPETCTLSVVDGCEVVGMVFTEPARLADILDAASNVGGVALKVYRTDYLCITEVAFADPDETERFASRSAYVDPEYLRAARIASQNNETAPPITGGHIIPGFYDEAAEEWARAQEPMVRFDGAVVHVPAAATEALAAIPWVGWVGDVAWDLSPSYDRAVYPGEIMVGSNALDAVAINPRPVPPSCR